MTRRDKLLTTVGVVLTLLIGLRIILPYAMERFVNRTLASLEGYDGYVEDIDLALWRGAYSVEGVHIVRTGVEHPTPFFTCDLLRLTVEWPSLLKGSLVAEGEVLRPVLNLVRAETKEESQLGTETHWPTFLADYYPFDINTFRVRNGTVTFRAPGIRTQDALTANNVNALVTNLTNVTESNKETFARFQLQAAVLNEAPLKMNGSIDPLANQPTFDVNLALDRVELTELNPWLRQFAKADAQSGEFELYLEIAAADGKFTGYAKPITENVEMYGSQDKDDNLLRKAWEGLVEFAANIVENEEEDQVAARVPFSGTIQNPDANMWLTIVSVLRNAFVSAFARSLEGSISIRDVRQNLSEIGESSGIENADDKKEKAEKRDQDEDESQRDRRFGPRATG